MPMPESQNEELKKARRAFARDLTEFRKLTSPQDGEGRDRLKAVTQRLIHTLWRFIPDDLRRPAPGFESTQWDSRTGYGVGIEIGNHLLRLRNPEAALWLTENFGLNRRRDVSVVVDHDSIGRSVRRRALPEWAEKLKPSHSRGSA